MEDLIDRQTDGEGKGNGRFITDHRLLYEESHAGSRGTGQAGRFAVAELPTARTAA